MARLLKAVQVAPRLKDLRELGQVLVDDALELVRLVPDVGGECGPVQPRHNAVQERVAEVEPPFAAPLSGVSLFERRWPAQEAAERVLPALRHPNVRAVALPPCVYELPRGVPNVCENVQ